MRCYFCSKSSVFIIMIDYLIFGEVWIIDSARLHSKNEIRVKAFDKSRENAIVAVVLFPRFYVLFLF